MDCRKMHSKQYFEGDGIKQCLQLSAIALVFLLSAVASYGQTPAPYKVGPEDVIIVSVARHPEFSGEYFVTPDGVLNLPAAGKVSVTGKTLDELSKLIADQLRSRLRDPEVTVALKTPRMQRVYVLGVVDKPGLYDMKPGWRITEAIAAAGGLTAKTEPADCVATVLRASTGKRQSIKLKDVFAGTPDANTAVESGDVLTIEAVETMPVYVMGKVKAPGLYNVRKDSAGLLEAITLAGGIAEDAALDKVTITHLDKSSQVVNIVPVILEGKQDVNVVLRSGDLVVVPEETSRVAVLGFVTEPGFYPLKNGRKLTLSEALAQAKGADKRGKLSSVVVVRKEDGKQQRMVFDLNKFLKSGDISQNPEIKPGDVVYVPETSKLNWDKVFGALTAIGILL